MELTSQSGLRVVVDAQVSLARAGLERVAKDAGLTVVSNELASVASLRTEGAAHQHPKVDVSVGPSSLTLTVRSEPSPELWEALLRVVSALVDSESPATAESPGIDEGRAIGSPRHGRGPQ